MAGAAGVMFLVLFFSGCGRGKIEAGSPEEVLSLIRDKGNSQAVLDYYTDETISLMNKYVKMTGMKNEASIDILSFIPESSEYSISGKTVEGDTCYLNLVFSKHTSENGIGQVISLKMIKEGDSWKIDRKDDFKKLIDSYEKRGAEEYLNRIR
jgi:CRISPR/Cas system type I-B associated protein Csh2 (Cas7 group RAMP superfamily)